MFGEVSVTKLEKFGVLTAIKFAFDLFKKNYLHNAWWT